MYCLKEKELKRITHHNTKITLRSFQVYKDEIMRWDNIGEMMIDWMNKVKKDSDDFVHKFSWSMAYRLHFETRDFSECEKKKSFFHAKQNRQHDKTSATMSQQIY